jgi:transcriptional regulator with XRE-family HTH domain
MGRGSTFGDRLRAERVAAGLTQLQLGERVGLSRSMVAMLETGRSSVLLATASKVARALDVSVADLVMEGGDLFEVEFVVGEVERSTPPPWMERKILAQIHGPAPVSVWPYRGDGVLRLRARASSLASIASLAGRSVDGIPVFLPAPTVRPVEPSGRLSVLLRARSGDEAREYVDKRLAAAECSPRVAVDKLAGLWRVRLARVPRRASLALQGIVATSPIGLFVPACQ